MLQQILSKCVLLRAVYELDADVAGAMMLFTPFNIPHKDTLSSLTYTFSPPILSCPYHIPVVADIVVVVVAAVILIVVVVVITGAVCEDTKSERNAIKHLASSVHNKMMESEIPEEEWKVHTSTRLCYARLSLHNTSYHLTITNALILHPRIPLTVPAIILRVPHYYVGFFTRVF